MDKNIGLSLQTLRKERSLSIQALARKSGLAAGFISQVERGKNSISVASLKRLLDALATSLSAFFSESKGGDTQKIFYRADEMKEIGPGKRGLQLLELAAGRPDRKLQVLREIYAPGADTGPGHYRHEAEEASICVEGSVEVTVGNEKFILKSGDGVYFDSNLPHRVRNTGKKRAVVISVNTPPSF